MLEDWDYTVEAETLYRQALAIQRDAPPSAPAEPTTLAETLVGYGSAMLHNGHAAQAEPILREALALRRQTERRGHWLIAQAQSMLGDCLISLGRVQEAGPMLEEACDMIDVARQVPPDVKRRALESLAHFYTAQGNAEARASGPAENHGDFQSIGRRRGSPLSAVPPSRDVRAAFTCFILPENWCSRS